MIIKEEAKEKLKELIKYFSEIQKSHLDSMPEEDIKFQFIEPLFEILGWGRKDIQKEARVLKGRADYILKNGNQESLVIEAKKTNVSLTEDEGRRAVSYAYHRKIKFSVLTNFKYVRVYHALSNIKNIDRNLLFWLEFKDFEKEFDKLWLLSKESFEKQEINKLLSKKDEKQFIPVDESILTDLLEIRRLLSNDLKKLRMYLTDEKIDEAIQILIDRLIFMRSVEDRKLEAENFLLGLVKDSRDGRLKTKLWHAIQEQFRTFDKNYNSKLFSSGILEDEKNIFIDDETLEKVIRILYFGVENKQARYMFDEIPGDLLGSIYEQYLGVVLRGTEKRVKLEKGTGKRKKMGIYYTPSYIVDYIVKNTVGEYLKDKTIDEILDINICDPACGSGSFLIKAFKEVCDAVEEKLKKGEKAKNPTFKNYEGRLNLAQKITIATRCIYGVDLDEKAVELAQLNLLLNLLEGETKETKKLLLPNLRGNIKNGNSLIDDSSVAGDKAFNWNAQFPDVFREGGFDVVIGNPPYVDYSKIQGTDYINKNFESAKVDNKVVKYNLFQLFIEKAINLLKKKGIFGFINPNTYLSADNALSLRKIILEKTNLKQIVDVSKLSIFKDASTYPVITIFEKENDENNYLGIAIIKEEKDITPDLKLNKINQEEFKKDNKLNFMISSNSGNKEIMSKLDSYDKLDNYQKNFVWGSSITGFATHEAENKNNDKKYSPLISTKDIKRYFIDWKKRYIENKIYSDKLKELFKQRKIVIARVTKEIQATIDEESYYIGKSSILIPKNEKLFEILLAILNSKLINYYYKMKFETTHMSGGYIRFDIPYLKLLPVRLPSPPQEQKIISLVNQMLSLQKTYHDEKISGGEKERLEQQIKNVDYSIDEEVYKLYGINDEEKKIIEESLK